jgi:hypothetical protein
MEGRVGKSVFYRYKSLQSNIHALVRNDMPCIDQAVDGTPTVTFGIESQRVIGIGDKMNKIIPQAIRNLSSSRVLRWTYHGHAGFV